MWCTQVPNVTLTFIISYYVMYTGSKCDLDLHQKWLCDVYMFQLWPWPAQKWLCDVHRFQMWPWPPSEVTMWCTQVPTVTLTFFRSDYVMYTGSKCDLDLHQQWLWCSQVPTVTLTSIRSAYVMFTGSNCDLDLHQKRLCDVHRFQLWPWPPSEAMHGLWQLLVIKAQMERAIIMLHNICSIPFLIKLN